MKTLPFLILIFIFSCSSPIPAQQDEEEETGFAFVENVKGKNGNIQFLKKAAYQKKPQYKAAKKVFDDLVEARGDFRMRIPTFVMSNMLLRPRGRG